MGNWLSSLLRQIAMVLWHLGWHLLVFVAWVLPPFWRGRHYFYLARHAWAPGLLWIGGCDASWIGAERIDWTRPHVIVANHQSNADVPALFMLVPTPLRFLAKRSVGRIPVLGWMLRLAGFPFIDRQSARRGRASIDAVARRIREEALNVVVFPEGTRSPEGTILPFKKGAFLLAIKAQVPVLPVAIEGGGAVFPRGSFRIYPGQALRVTVGEPLPTEGLTERDRDDLCARAEAQLVSMLGWRRIRPAELARARAEDHAARRRAATASTRDATHGAREAE